MKAGGQLTNKEIITRLRIRRINQIFAAIEPLVRNLEKNRKGNLKEDCLKPDPVPRTGQGSNFLLKDLDSLYNF